MGPKLFSLIFSAALLIGSMTQNKGKFSQNLQKKLADIDNKYKNRMSPRKLDESNNYIIIYFRENFIYPTGLYNSYREDISYIIKTDDQNNKLNKTSFFSIDKEYGIEIHFDEKVTNLNNFFSIDYDMNMQYLISVDFSNFDSIFGDFYE